jgi:hypothetical protein
MRQLPFLDPEYEHGPIRDFWYLRDHGIPKTGGVYILLAKPGITFMYPRRRSSVFYIGQAKNLHNRLFFHLRAAEEAKNYRRWTLYMPYYEYAAALGARYVIIPATHRENPKLLEDDVLACFAEHYRSWPVANGAGGWGSLLSLTELEKRNKKPK